MSYSFIALLPDRGLIELRGPDAAKFLQGLITNDIGRAQPGQAIFAGLLTPQGKILSDFFLYAADPETFWIDCPKTQTADLIKRFSLYKLRAKIEIADRSAEFAVGAVWGAKPQEGESGFFAAYTDPRYAPLGDRFILRGEHRWPESLASSILGDEAYHSHRIALAVPQGGLDYAYGEAFPHEACYDDLHGVDFKKGCYVGQEVVSRMHHKGTAKTRIVAVEADVPLAGGGIEILAGDKPVGQLGSADGKRGIAMMRLDRAGEAMTQKIPLRAGNIVLIIHRPPWASYDVPSEGMAH
jgi:folate-binding protein YgfZ